MRPWLSSGHYYISFNYVRYVRPTYWTDNVQKGILSSTTSIGLYWLRQAGDRVQWRQLGVYVQQQTAIGWQMMMMRLTTVHIVRSSLIKFSDCFITILYLFMHFVQQFNIQIFVKKEPFSIYEHGPLLFGLSQSFLVISHEQCLFKNVLQSFRQYHHHSSICLDCSLACAEMPGSAIRGLS